jgi:hypothetical protein
MSLFSPEPAAVPQEDIAVKRLRDDQQARAEEDRLKSIQAQLRNDTRMRNRVFGVKSLLGSSSPLSGSND